MWIVELTFTGETERLAARAEHRSRLASLHGQRTVRMAGPLADDSGAVIIFDAASRRNLDDLLHMDPYFTTPGVTIAQIRDWRPFLE